MHTPDPLEWGNMADVAALPTQVEAVVVAVFDLGGGEEPAA